MCAGLLLRFPPRRFGERAFRIAARTSSNYRRTEEQIDEVRIELRTASSQIIVEAFLTDSRETVRARMGNCIESVGNCDDARFHRNATTLQAAGVAVSVPSLVVRKNAFRKIRVKTRQAAGAHPRRLLGVLSIALLSLGSQFLRVADDVGERAVDFSDIVE